MSDIVNELTGENTVSKEDYQSDLALFSANLKYKEGAAIASAQAIANAKSKLEEGLFDAQLENVQKLIRSGLATEEDLKKARMANVQKIAELAHICEENLFKFSTMSQKKQITEQKIATLKQGKEDIKQAMAVDAARLKGRYALSKEAKKQREELIATGKLESAELAKRKALEKGTQAESKQALAAKMDAITEISKAEVAQHEENIANIDEQIAALEEKKKNSKNAKDGGAYDKEIEKLKSEKASEEGELKKSKKEAAGAELTANAIKGMQNAIQGSLVKLGEDISKAVDDAIDTVGKYRGHIDARLNGYLGQNVSAYDKFAKTMKSTLAVSPFVKQTELLEKLNTAVDAGIAYNVEQRAFLATVTDKIVSTFDAFDSNLMRIIRLQQADSTAARMGLEAELLQFFNSTFQDSSYLTNGFDDVSKALLDVNAQLDKNMSISFEYNVQKWMGSLASLGFSTETINKIATGVNYIGTGNVQALAGDTSLQNLMAMSASRAGLPLSEMLTNGLDDSNVNTLLKAMVEYLKEIAEDENAVVKSAYGDIFNFTQSDLRALKNLTTNDIANISSQTMNFSKAIEVTQNQLNQLPQRLHVSEMIDNVMDNFMFTSGETLANNPITAVTWKLLSTLEGATGGIHLPAVSVMGNMVDLSTFTIEGIAKAGIFGLSALSNIGNMITSISSGGGLDLGAWQESGWETTKRGGQFQSTVKGVTAGTSGSQKKAKSSGSESDTKEQAISDTEEDTQKQKKKSADSADGAKSVDDLYKAIIDNKVPVTVYNEELPGIAQHIALMSSYSEELRAKTVAMPVEISTKSKLYQALGESSVMVTLVGVSEGFVMPIGNTSSGAFTVQVKNAGANVTDGVNFSTIKQEVVNAVTGLGNYFVGSEDDGVDTLYDVFKEALNNSSLLYKTSDAYGANV